ncbi:dienelactone hydrolase family protein [Streptosporangium carneum]|uniref:Hydrolase n=1 Tax=Streptosporangium carneum TaxID=47481 RepID=A0A9W6I0G9_9ACTN|nr:dienelactone hydrolase family protein [Streptosporangium carneum]GLK08933.1 hydrolase [Streptosporangium carneum]
MNAVRMNLERLEIPAADVVLEADVVVPRPAGGVVLFAHGSGSSRHSPRNRHVAGELQRAGLATVLVDLLTPSEERVDLRTAEFRFDIGRLAVRLAGLARWLVRHEPTAGLRVGLFGASTGAAAALVAAAARPAVVKAVVSRGGRPDLAGEALSSVRAPTLLVVGECDPVVVALNREAMGRLPGETRLEVVPGASHLFEEPGALEEVARLAAEWFLRHLPRTRDGEDDADR